MFLEGSRFRSGWPAISIVSKNREMWPRMALKQS